MSFFFFSQYFAVSGTIGASLHKMQTSMVGAEQPSGVIAALLKKVAFSASFHPAGVIGASLQHPVFAGAGAESQTGTIAAALQGMLFGVVPQRRTLTIIHPIRYGVFIHNPWGPYERIAELTTAHNVDRSYERMQPGSAVVELPVRNLDPRPIRQGNLLVIVSRDQPVWAGPILMMKNQLSSGTLTLSAIGLAALLDGRVSPQGQQYTTYTGSGRVIRDLLNNANAHGHTGISLGRIEPGPSVDDLIVGGQTVMQSLEELYNRTNFEWWLDIEAGAGHINATLNWGWKQGEDLASKVHLWYGRHFKEVELDNDVSKGKQVTVAYGGFGQRIPDRPAVSRSAAIGPQRIDIGALVMQNEGAGAFRTEQDLPASLRTERSHIEVTTSSPGELGRRASKEQLRQVLAETAAPFTANKLCDWNALKVGNYVTLHAPVGFPGNVDGPVRITGVQPDDELGEILCTTEARLG